MKVIHVITNATNVVLEPYIAFVNDNFRKSDHLFLITDTSENIRLTSLKYSNVVKSNSISNRKKLYKECDKIIFHGLSINIIIKEKLISPSLFNKIVWVAWGADIYQWVKTPKYSIKNGITNSLGYFIRKKIKQFVGVFPPDIDFFKQEFSSRARTFYASYAGNLMNPFYTKNLELVSLNEKTKENKTINIQIGHQANPTLNHLAVLEDLKEFKDKNIKIFIPLSYGGQEHSNKVERLAKEFFGDKVSIMREMMPKDEYMKHLSEMDIAIFNTTRQIGLGNITPLLFTLKKLYMPKGSVMYEFYRSQDIEIIDYGEIKNMSYNDFISPVNMEKARTYVIENELDKSRKIKIWSDVFNAPME